MSRQITRQAVNAMFNRENFKKSNTEVIYNEIDQVSFMYLFKNLIAILNYNTKELTITTAGWDTNTTRERLNGLPRVYVYRSKGQLYLNGTPWDGNAETLKVYIH